MRTGNRNNVGRGRRSPVFATWLAIRSRGRVCDRWRSLPAYPRRCDRRVRAGQRAMADCGAVSMGATDDPVRMRNGMIQINTAARLPPKEFAQ